MIAAAEATEAVILRAPDFAPGWALLPVLHDQYVVMNQSRTEPDGTESDQVQTIKRSLAITRDAAARAAALDPDNVDVLIAVALSQTYFATFAEAEDTYRKALAIDPTKPDLLVSYGYFLRIVGRNREALTVFEARHGLADHRSVASFRISCFHREPGQRRCR